MIFYNSGAAAWSCFGLICAVLLAFIVHYYWKKNKGGNIVPTSEGYEGFQFEKQQLEEENQKLKGEIEELERETKKLVIANEVSKANYAAKSEELDRSEANKNCRIKELEKKIEELQKSNSDLTYYNNKHKEQKDDLKTQYESAWNFYDDLWNKGIERDIEKLVEYKKFHEKNYRIIERMEREERERMDRIKAGQEFERSWKPSLEQQFTEEELELIEITSQPSSQEKKRGDYEVSFKDNKNSCNADKWLNIYVEHKYVAPGEEGSIEQLNSVKHREMDKDLQEALIKASKSKDKKEYDFIFFITNRDIGQERFRKKGFFWVSSDKDYEFFKLKPPTRVSQESHQIKPAIIIMTWEKSIEFLWSFYTLWENWSSLKTTAEYDELTQNISSVFDSKRFAKSLTTWINEAENVITDVSSSMEFQWKKLFDRIRIISDEWIKRKKKVNDLSCRAQKLRMHSEWLEPLSIVSHHLSEEKEVQKDNDRERLNYEIKDSNLVV